MSRRGDRQLKILERCDEARRKLRIERINELMDCEPAVMANEWKVPEQPKRYLTVELSFKDIVWAYDDESLDDAAKSIESSDTEREDCIVYDLDEPKSYRPMMKVVDWYRVD